MQRQFHWLKPWNFPLRHRAGLVGNQVQLVIRTEPHKIRIGGEVPGKEVEEEIVEVALEILVDLVEDDKLVVDTGEEEEGAALGL